MTRRSLVGPLLLIALGGLFLANSLNPDIPLFRLIALYWPFLLIGWGALRLIEILALAAARRPYPSGIGGGEIALIVLICVAGSGMHSFHRHFEGRVRLGPWGPRTLEIFGEEHGYQIEVAREVKGVKRVVVEQGRGNVRVTGGNAGSIKVTGRKSVRAYEDSGADRVDRETPVEISVEGDRAVIRTNQDRATGNARVSADIEVSVPSGAAVEVRSRGGDIDVIDAASVHIDSDNAAVRIEKAAGNVRIETRQSDLIRALDVKGNLDIDSRGSDIELENIAGEVRIRGSYSGSLQFQNLAKPLVYESRQTELRFAGLPGRITMDLGRFNGANIVGPMRFVTKSRDIQVENVSNAVELETERGDIEIRALRIPLARIEARSRSGNIEVALPEKARFQLDAITEHGEARNDFGSTIIVTTEGPSSAMKGTIGDGPLIKLQTQRGFVAVRRSEMQVEEANL
jgi:DUF4097 and DUF4098 domain-containing protein YvlB